MQKSENRNELSKDRVVGRARTTAHTAGRMAMWGHGAEPECGPAYCKRPYLPPPHQDPHHPHFLPFLPSRTSPDPNSKTSIKRIVIFPHFSLFNRQPAFAGQTKV